MFRRCRAFMKCLPQEWNRMKKIGNIRKKLAVGCLLGILSMGMLTGCQSQTRIVFTTGLYGNQIFKIGSMACTMPEAMIYLTTFYNQYEEIYGSEMWTYDFGGVTLEDHVKEVVLSKLAQIKVMNLMAKENDIALTGEEEKKAEEAAVAYMEALDPELAEAEGITAETAKKVYREYATANKVYTAITESAEMEISDDEARTVTVQEIRVSELETAREALQKLRQGETFETVAARYSEVKQGVKSYGRGAAEEALEEVLFSMDEGDISNVIGTAEGYVIVKCISTMDYEATQENKLVLAEKRKKEAFLKAYREIAENTHSQFRDKRWEKVVLKEDLHRTDANFFDIYKEYVKQ